MCVFIYVQGQKRAGALSSTWMFHEVALQHRVTKKVIGFDRPMFVALVDNYLRPAGVSEAWIAQMMPRTVQSDYWQTGENLVNEKSGIITNVLGNQDARTVEAPDGREKVARVEPPAARKAAARR